MTEKTPEEILKEKANKLHDPDCPCLIHFSGNAITLIDALEAVRLAREQERKKTIEEMLDLEKVANLKNVLLQHKKEKKQTYLEGVEDGHREFFADYPEMKKALEEQAKELFEEMEKLNEKRFVNKYFIDGDNWSKLKSRFLSKDGSPEKKEKE